MVYSPLEYLISTLAPLECYICQTEGAMLCPECQPEIVDELTSRCYLCNSITSQQRICKYCKSKSALRRVWWLGSYEKVLKALIFDMKYARKRAYARSFGGLLNDALPYLPEHSLVVPIPTATTRIRQRGFDQAALIAGSFASLRGLKLSPVLYRTNQSDQIGKSRIERQKQMATSQALRNPESVQGRSILLVDDVLTTGASLESAARLLRKHGASHVDAAVVARNLLR